MNAATCEIEASAPATRTSVHSLDVATRGTAPKTELAALLDRAHLARYTLGDKALETEILGLFIDQLPLTLQWLELSATSREWGHAAHTLKGSARAVGAFRLAELALGLEHLDTPLDQRKSALAPVRSAIDEVTRHVRSL